MFRACPARIWCIELFVIFEGIEINSQTNRISRASHEMIHKKANVLAKVDYSLFEFELLAINGRNDIVDVFLRHFQK